ncbi:MAG: hypothetical protein P8Y48_01755 [Novosphingobium sp.]
MTDPFELRFPLARAGPVGQAQGKEFFLLTNLSKVASNASSPGMYWFQNGGDIQAVHVIILLQSFVSLHRSPLGNAGNDAHCRFLSL